MRGRIEKHNRVFWGQICYGQVVWNVYNINIKKSGQFETNCEFFELITDSMLTRGKAMFLLRILHSFEKTACSEKNRRNIGHEILGYKSRETYKTHTKIS